MASLQRLGRAASKHRSIFGRTQTRFASAEYAEMKVKKNNFVEQNEIRRENSFVRWTPDRTNGTGLFVMCILFPVVIYALSKAEWEYRDVAVSKLEKPRARF